MPNDFFEFKKFTVFQKDCAMKVCTDACLFGAWVADILTEMNAENILDIGTGTGLLSSMIAQKNKEAKIDAIEIDEKAARQAASNFAASQWQERLKVFNIAIQNFIPEKKYDFIICNPPFFENDLKGKNAKRNLALHDTSLTLNELPKCIDALISANGKFALLLPYSRTNFFVEMAFDRKLFLQKKILVKQTENHQFFRSMCLFGKEKLVEECEYIFIKDAQNEYSAAFAALLKDYYLSL